MQKRRCDRYYLSQFSAVPWIPNQRERRSKRMEWSVVLKAAERSRRQRQVTCWQPMALIRWSWRERNTVSVEWINYFCPCYCNCILINYLTETCLHIYFITGDGLLIETIFITDWSTWSGTTWCWRYYIPKDYSLWHSTSSAELCWWCHVSFLKHSYCDL